MLAQQAAVYELGQEHIGTEHLLLALAREQRGMAARVLAARAVTAERVRELLPDSPRGEQGPGEGFRLVQVPFTPGAKRALEHALKEAVALGHNAIGTEHVLLGLMRSADGALRGVLVDLDLTPEQLRGDVIAAFSGDGPV